MREAFRALGHDAWSCDLLPADDGSPHHIQRDIFEAIHRVGFWDLIVLHPPCTYLTVSGLHWNKKDPARALLTEEAIAFVSRLMSLYPVVTPRLALENPVGCISSRIRKPDQIVQPYDFGDDASKKTCFWLFGLEKLPIDKSKRCNGRQVVINGKTYERWSNQTDSGQNRLAPSADRWKLRSETYSGLAEAAALRWGGPCEEVA